MHSNNHPTNNMENDMNDQATTEKPALEASSNAQVKGNAMFRLGQIAGTPAAIEQLRSIGITPAELLARHVTGDWGNLCPDDKETNLEAARFGGRILSSYDLACGTVWVITEADRSVTTILLPSEY